MQWSRMRLEQSSRGTKKQDKAWGRSQQNKKHQNTFFYNSSNFGGANKVFDPAPAWTPPLLPPIGFPPEVASGASMPSDPMAAAAEAVGLAAAVAAADSEDVAFDGCGMDDGEGL